jgi:hypothetical protein
MTFDELVDLVKNTLLKNQPLNVADLQSPSITQVASDALPNNLIRLDVSQEKDPFEEDAKNNRVVVRGKGIDPPFAGLESELQFYFVNGVTALTWSATTGAGWNLSTGFPQLESTICAEIPFASTPAPQIVLNSNTPQGIFFTGTIDLNKMTGGLAGVLGIDAIKISGPVTLKNNGSVLQKIDFKAPDIPNINLGIIDKPLTLNFAIGNRFIKDTISQEPYVSPYILLSTEIPFTVKGTTHSIPISLQLADLDSDQRFSADPTQLIDAGLDEISSLANKADLQNFKFPENFHIEDVLKFTEFFFDFNLTSKTVTLIGIGVESARPWTILHLNASEQDLIIETVGIDFRIVDPFAEKPNISVTLSGEVEFGKADKNPGILIFHARYPDWSIGAYLKQGTSLSLAETLQPLLGSSAKVPDLSIEAFDLELASGSYELKLDLDGTWCIPDTPEFILAIDEIGFSIKHANAETAASAEARFDIATYEVDITADHPAGANDGWTFKGEATANPDDGPTQVSQFLSENMDDVFSSAASSGVPQMLSAVEIKQLGIDFNTQTKDFHFDAEIDFANDVDATVTFSNLHQEGATPPAFEKRATGVIKVFPGKPNEFAFDLGLDLQTNSKHFVALYSNTSGKPINLTDLVKAMFPKSASMSLPSFDVTIKDAIVGYVSDATESQSVFALDMDASIDLTSLGKIPLIGKSLSAAKTLKFAFQVLYPVSPQGKPFTTDDLKALNELITVAGPQFPTDQPLTELDLKTELRIGDSDPIDFNLPVKIDNTNGQLDDKKPATFNPPAGSQSTDDGVKWFQLNEKFGPVHLQRAGFKFESGKLTALLDGGFTALGLEVDLMGLSVTSKITGLKNGEFKPEFGLDGLALSFSKGGVSFAGALLRKDQDGYEYDGLATVQAEGLRLAAIGSLTTVNDQTALFLYGVLDYALGGSPFFYVTGLAAGFGVNEKLTMPAVDQVSTFPLIQAAKNPPTIPTDPDSAGPFIANEVQSLRTYLAPNIGQYFGCAGIKFTSFELLDSFVLVSISFGREFELDLVGLSTLVVPPQLPANEPALATVSLQIVGSFIPNEGLAIVQGRLTTDSYILDPSCHLTGGFAFATWFGTNAHAGDFVITIGGYHPDFQKPDYYPIVPRVGIAWKISTELNVTGGLYFALTPRALMAGGAMKAIFQTSLDLSIATVDVKAWFILGADFIIYWKPFHYSAHLYIDIGIDVIIHFLGTHEISFDAGADLQVWGPKFGGHARVYVKVIGIKIGFNVDFGAADTPPALLDWDNADASKSFRKSFLPADDKIVSVAVGEGLVRKINVGPDATPDYWFVINPKDFRLRTNSVIPIKNAVHQASAREDVQINTDFGIASMGKDESHVNTSHQIKVTRNNKPADASFLLSPVLSSVPGGLWANENSSDVNAHSLIENALVGFEILPAKPPVPGHTKSIARDLLEYTTHDMGNAYSDNEIHAFTATEHNPGNNPADNERIWSLIQTGIHTNATRDQMLGVLGFNKTDLDIGEAFTTDAAYAPSYGTLSVK